jgi:hypothetical protein
LAPAQTAKQHLEKALQVAQKEGYSVTESEIAEHHYKLGRILWTMGGSLRDNPNQARAHFEAASREECDSQVRLLLIPPGLHAARHPWCSAAASSCPRKQQTSYIVWIFLGGSPGNPSDLQFALV